MASPEWVPTEDLTTAAIQLLDDSNSLDNAVRAHAYSVLESVKDNPQFVQTVAFLVAFGHTVPARTRKIAAATLKSLIDQRFHHLPEESRSYIKACLLALLAADDSGDLKRLAANAVSTIVRNAGVEAWTELPGAINAALRGILEHSGDAAALRPWLLLTNQITMDNPDVLESAESGVAVAEMYPLLIHVLSLPLSGCTALALDSLSNLQHCVFPTKSMHRDAFLSALGNLMCASTPIALHSSVCKCLSTLVETSLEDIWPAMSAIMDFQLQSLDAPSEEICCDAADFWGVLAEHLQAYSETHSTALDVLVPYIPTLVEKLAHKLMLTDADLEGMQADDVDNRHVPDRVQDVAPAAKEKRTAGNEATMADPSSQDDDDDDGDDIVEDTGGDPHAGSATWTPRRAASAALDLLAIVHPVPVLTAAYGIIGTLLSMTGDEHWKAREAGLLLLGVLANGCTEVLADRLPEITTFVCPCADDPRPLVRCIAIWTLSKYCDWMVERYVTASDDADRSYQDQFVAVAVRHAVDHNKGVQEYALKALVSFCNTAVEACEDYVESILGTLIQGLAFFQLRCRLCAYDCIAALAENTPETFSRREYTSVVIPLLVTQVQACPEESFELTVLLGCLSGVVPAVGLDMADSMSDLFARAAHLIQRGLMEEAAAEAVGSRSGGANSTRIANCLDLIESILDVGGDAATELVTAHGVLDSLPYLLKNPSSAVQQSAFALLGTMTTHQIEVLRPIVADALACCAASITDTPGNEIVCSNACWAASELMYRLPAESGSSVMPLLERLAGVIFAKEMPRVTFENIALLLGCIGINYGGLIAPGLNTICSRWIKCVQFLVNASERSKAMRGLCHVVAINPRGAERSLRDLALLFVDHVTRVTADPESIEAMKAAWAAIQGTCAAERVSAAIAALPAESLPVLQVLLTPAASG